MEDFESDERFTCPCCEEERAILLNNQFWGEVAYCGSCGFEWKELIELNNDTNKLEYIGDFTDIFEIMSDDYKRYEEIIKYSNLMYSGQDKKEVYQKQKKYFSKKLENVMKHKHEDQKKFLKDFIKTPKIDKLKTLFIHLIDIGKPGFIFPSDSFENVQVIGYKEWNINALSILGIKIEDLKSVLEEDFNIKLVLFKGFNSYTEEEQKELEKLNSPENIEDKTTRKNYLYFSEANLLEIRDISADIKLKLAEDKVIEKEHSNKEKNFKKVELKVELKVEFLENNTTYSKTIKELIEISKEAKDIGSYLTTNPYIYPIDFYYHNIDNFTHLNSIIDFQNGIVFVNVNIHKLLNILSDTNIEKFLQSNDMLLVFHNNYSIEDIKFNDISQTKNNSFKIMYNQYNSQKINYFFGLLNAKNIGYSVYCFTEKEIKLDGFMQKSLELLEDLLNNTPKETLQKEMAELMAQDNEVENTAENDIDFNEFLSTNTTYGITIDELHDIIEDCTPIGGFNTSKPFIIPMEEYLKNIDFNVSIPSLLDFSNNIAFMNISHKYLIETLCEELLNISSSTYSFDDIENQFHKRINAIQIFVNSRNRDNTFPLMLTCSFEQNSTEQEILTNALKSNNIDFDYMYIGNNKNSFIPLSNITEDITGNAYFVKENDEEIPEGQILIIPTATEEYFLSTLGNHGKKGCIITEKGSKTSHIVLLSKEFNFNIILVENASKLFKEGDYLHINAEDRIISIFE